MPIENQEQDLGWAPTRYPVYVPTERGEWRAVLEDDQAVAVVWTNNGQAAGINWLLQTETVMAINKMLIAGATGGFPAQATYKAVEAAHGDALGPTATGTMSGVDELLTALMND